MQNDKNRPETAQIFAYERKENSAVIWRCFSHDTKAVIPSELDGYPVTEIAAYAFSAHMDQKILEKEIESGHIQFYVPEAFREISIKKTEAEEIRQMSGSETLEQMGTVLCGDALEEIVIPASVQRVGRYCFYNCSKLRLLEFWSTLADWGSGVFTGSHKIRQMYVHAVPGQPSSLKQVLDEIYEELYTTYQIEAGAGTERGNRETKDTEIAHLVFPEYYVEGVENTPARILEEHIHGTGMKYRNCFKGKEFDFRQYDSLFPHAIVQEPENVVGKLAVGRLRCPYQLSHEAKEQYLVYVQAHAARIAEWILKEQDMEAFRWLLTAVTKSEELFSEMTELAAKLQNAEAISLLMEASKSGQPKIRKRRMEL